MRKSQKTQKINLALFKCLKSCLAISIFQQRSTPNAITKKYAGIWYLMQVYEKKVQMRLKNLSTTLWSLGFENRIKKLPFLSFNLTSIAIKLFRLKLWAKPHSNNLQMKKLKLKTWWELRPLWGKDKKKKRKIRTWPNDLKIYFKIMVTNFWIPLPESICSSSIFIRLAFTTPQLSQITAKIHPNESKRIC